MKFQACSALAIAAAAFASPALAQDEQSSGIEEIVVEARKTAENLQTVPVAVTVPTGETLDKAQVGSLDQLTRVVPGIVIQPSTGQPASAFIGIRGQAASDALLAIDQAVGQYFDGVYVARSSGALFNFVDVERVEVLRGAQGTLFGRNTTGGAVSIISKKPTGEFGGSVRLAYGNYDQFEATGILNLPIQGDQIATRFSYQHKENGSYGTNRSFGTGLGGDKVDSFRGALKIAPDEIPLRINIVGDYSRRRGEGQVVGLKSFSTNGTANAVLATCSGPTANALCPVTRPAGDSYANYALSNSANGVFDNNFYNPFNSMVPFSRADAWGVGITTEYDISDATTIKSITAWRDVNTESVSDNDGTPYVLTGGLREGDGNIISQSQFTQELQLSTKALDGRLEFILGGYYFNERGRDLSKSYSAFPLGARRLGYNDGDIKNKSYAGFGQFNFRLTDTFRFTGGLRYTRDERSILRRNRAENTSATTGLPDGTFVCSLAVAAGAPCEALTTANFGYWSYTAGFDWRPTDNVFVYVKTNKASRAGGFNPRAIGTTPLVFNPETVKDYEFGFKLDLLDRRLRINTALFHTDYEGIQRTVPAIINNILSNTIINAAKASIEGAEIEVTAKPIDELQLGVSATFLSPKFKDFTIPLTLTTFQDVRDTPYSFLSRQSVSLYADYTVPLGEGELNLRADYSYRSSYFATGPLVGPGFNQQFKDTAKIPGYGLFNAQIAYQFADPDVELSLYAQNITKKKYITRLLAIENSLGVTAYSPGLPRMYGLRLTWKFGGEAN